jgi:hypothetical protein
MLVEFLAIGGLFFWGGLVALALLIGWIQDDNESVAMLLAGAALAGLFLFTDTYKYVTLSGVIYTAVVYSVLGVIYAFARWVMFIWDAIRKAKEDHTRFKSTKTIEEFAKDYRPVALQNKERLIGWMVLWPLSLVWDILSWPRRLFRWLYEYLTTTFERISNNIWNRAFK